MKTHNSILIIAIAATSLMLAANASAQGYYGSFYPKGTAVEIYSSPKRGFTNSGYTNALGDSWNYPRQDYCYATLSHTAVDFLTLSVVNNRNMAVAVTPDGDQLSRFMQGNSYSAYMHDNAGYGEINRSYGCFVQCAYISPGTTIGLGVRTSRWSGYNYTQAGTSYEAELRYNHGYEPGINPFRNSGRFSEYAWMRSGYVGPFSLSQPPLDMGHGHERRWIIGTFSVPADAQGNSRARYYLTQNASLTASTASNVFIIPESAGYAFLHSQPCSYYYKLNSGWDRREILLTPGRRYSIAVRDGVNTTSCEGAQVAVMLTSYQ